MIAFFVLSQAVISNVETDKDNQEQSDATDQEEQVVAQNIAIPSSSLQINLDYQSYLLEEVFYQTQDEENANTSDLILPTTQKALKILFRRIISPNAP